MHDCIMDLRKWMIRFRLMLNYNKTEFLLLGTKQQLAKVDINSIAVDESVLNTKPVVTRIWVPGLTLNLICLLILASSVA